MARKLTLAVGLLACGLMATAAVLAGTDASPHYDSPGGGGGGADTTVCDGVNCVLDDPILGASNIITIANGETLQWASATTLDGSTDGQLILTNAAGTSNVGTFTLGEPGSFGAIQIVNEGTDLAIERDDGTKDALLLNDAYWMGATSNKNNANIRIVGNTTGYIGMGSASGGAFYIGWNDTGALDGTDIKFSAHGPDITGATEERFACVFGGNTFTTATCNHEATFRMGDMDEDDTTTGHPGTVCDANNDGVIVLDEVDTLAAVRFGRGAEMCVEESNGDFVWRSVADLYASEYMNVGSGAISFTTSYATIDDGTSTFAAGERNNGFDLTTASGVLSPVDDASGLYQVTWQVSFVGTASTVYEVTVTNDNNSTQESQCMSTRSFGTGTPQTGSMSGTCIMTVNYVGDATDDIFLVMKSDNAGGANATITNAQLVLRKL